MEPFKGGKGTPLKPGRQSQTGPRQAQPTTHQGQRRQAVKPIPLAPQTGKKGR